MEVFVIKALQLILSLSILVVLHELGHFIPAKLFKTKVEKFYLFFNPGFSLFKYKKGETEYGIGWLPLGGYVKIAGMIDESMDKEQLKKDPEPWEFRAKPAWQRLIIMVGGVTVNVILGILIYAMILFTWGESFIAAKDVKSGVHVSEVAKEIGFKDGDQIVAVNGASIDNDITYGKLSIDFLLASEEHLVTVKNNGSERQVTVPSDFGQRMLANGEKSVFVERVPFVIDSILPNQPAAESSIEKGDRIIGFNDISTPYFLDFVKAIGDKKNEEITLHVERNGQEVDVPVKVNENGKIGVANQSPLNYFEVTHVDYGFAESFPAGVDRAAGTIKSYIDQFSLVFTKEGITEVGGFGAIGNLFPAQWNWNAFWNLTAFLSLVLAFMNILPIPALDGGHVMFLLYELVSGRKPNEKVLEYAQIAGMVVLLSLLVFANGNDLFKLFN